MTRNHQRTSCLTAAALILCFVLCSIILGITFYPSCYAPHGGCRGGPLALLESVPGSRPGYILTWPRR